MKKFLTLSCLFILSITNGQNIKLIDKNLTTEFNKINYWYNRTNENIDAYDSLEAANTMFEKLLLKFTNLNSKTISYNFKNLIDSGLIITTSEDGLFRIYTWNTRTGGTMRFYKTIFQYRNTNGTFSIAAKYNREQEEDPPAGAGEEKV